MEHPPGRIGQASTQEVALDANAGRLAARLLLLKLLAQFLSLSVRLGLVLVQTTGALAVLNHYEFSIS